jgi:hypothetical protein
MKLFCKIRLKTFLLKDVIKFKFIYFYNLKIILKSNQILIEILLSNDRLRYVVVLNL